MGKLLSLSARAAKPIDLEKVLAYPLYPVPLSLAHPDGSMRHTQKSKLLEVLSIEESNSNHPEKEVSALVIDMIAQIRTIVHNVPNTFEEFILKFLNSIPKGYQRVDIVADCYRDISIKAAEREKRGHSSKIFISSVKTKVPRDISKFLSNNENKKQLIELTFNYVIHNKIESFSILKAQTIILSGDGECKKITEIECCDYEILKSDHEEADTKVILHTVHALTDDNYRNVVLRSPSGDTDVLVIALGIIE